MTVEYREGNAFLGSAEAVVVTTNCVGAMGAGIALECKKRMPRLYRLYKEHCNNGRYSPGVIDPAVCFFSGKLVEEQAGHKHIILFPTKGDWRKPSKVEWVESGLYDLRNIAERNGITSVDMTSPGTSHGWIRDKNEVVKLIEDILHPSSVVFTVWEL